MQGKVEMKGLLLLVLVVLVGVIGGQETAPFKQSWVSTVPGQVSPTAPSIPHGSRTPKVALLWTFASFGVAQFSAVSLKDGKVLWTRDSFSTHVANQTYDVPYASAGYVSDAVLANYYLDSDAGGFVVQGFQLLDPMVRSHLTSKIILFC